MNVPLHERSLVELSAGLSAGEFTSRQLVQTYLDRIAAHDSQFHCFISVLGDQALALADSADRDRAAGKSLGPLAGIPIGIKDSIATAGIRTTSNSRVMEHWIPEADAEAIGHLRAAGAIVLGKTNLNEFGWALPSNTDLTPRTLNPWNPDYASIGSSSGSGAALAAGFIAAAIGTDGGGSTRLPAGQHNLVSLKATHGVVSHRGMGSSWVSEIAPMTRTVADTALLLSIMAQPGTASAEGIAGYVKDLNADISGWKIGVPRGLIEASNMEDEVTEAFDASLDLLRALGVELVDIDLRGMTEARLANFVMLNGQAHAAHVAGLRAHPELYGHSSKVYNWIGAFLSGADIVNANAVAARVQELLEQDFKNIRALVMPTSPMVTAEAARDPKTHRKGANAVFTAPFNATGHPAISVPCGYSASTGLPMGLQLVGAMNHEITLLQIAQSLEHASDWQAKQALSE